MSALQGTPATINLSDVDARLPSFNGDSRSLYTLELHIELCKIGIMIQQSKDKSIEIMVLTNTDQLSMPSLKKQEIIS
jgi:hypothetical protein